MTFGILILNVDNNHIKYFSEVQPLPVVDLYICLSVCVLGHSVPSVEAVPVRLQCHA